MDVSTEKNNVKYMYLCGRKCKLRRYRQRSHQKAKAYWMDKKKKGAQPAGTCQPCA